jgi:hypothetical protein
MDMHVPRISGMQALHQKKDQSTYAAIVACNIV